MFARIEVRWNQPVNGAGWRWEPPPSYEYSCLSPLDYLEYLVLHASDRALMAHERISRFQGEVRAKREALFAGDAAAVQEGLAKLRAPGGTRSGKGTWQVLEGTTKIDCALFADEVTVFIEGKRTEPHLTRFRELPSSLLCDARCIAAFISIISFCALVARALTLYQRVRQVFIYERWLAGDPCRRRGTDPASVGHRADQQWFNDSELTEPTRDDTQAPP